MINRNLKSKKHIDKPIGIIPAAGRGLRMRPVTDNIPKALIEIQGKPLIETAIENLKIIGVEKIIIVTGYMEEKIWSYINARDFGVPIVFVPQSEQLGLVNAITVTLNHVTEDFVIFCPDNIYTDVNDLKETGRIFKKYKPPVLQLVTVTPTLQNNRSVFISGKLRNITSNLFDNGRGGFGVNMPLFSTGITFFSYDMIGYFRFFKNYNEEYQFPDFLYEIFNKQYFMLYLIKGMRYDLSAPKDIENYIRLQKDLVKTSGVGVSIIMINRDGKILLHLRDDKPNIPYPGFWALFGGSVSQDKTCQDAIKREIMEEINFKIINFGLLREFVQNNKREYAFVGEINKKLEELILQEGSSMKFFKPSEISNLNIRPDDKETLELYIRGAFK